MRPSKLLLWMCLALPMSVGGCTDDTNGSDAKGAGGAVQGTGAGTGDASLAGSGGAGATTVGAGGASAGQSGSAGAGTSPPDASVTGDASMVRPDDATVPDAPPGVDPVIQVGGGTLKLEVWGPRTIRVLFTTTATPTPSLGVVATKPPTPFTVDDAGTKLVLTTASLRAEVDKATGRVTFFDLAGATILAESAGTARSLTTAMVAGQATLQPRQSFVLTAGESLYGLGQHQQRRATYNGARQTLAQQNTEIAIPVLVSSRGYGVLWDNPASTTVDATSPTAVVWTSEAAKAVDYYFMYGPEIDDVIADYRALTGAAPMFGRWAWGYWQSKEHYNTQTELLDIVHGYRQRMIPIDGIVQDWFYWNPAPWGSHEFNAQRYPDPAAMFADAHANHFHVLLSVWAKFEPASTNYNALNAAGLLYAGTAARYYDAFSAQGRATYWQQMRDELFTKGVDAWWLDATEPEMTRVGELHDLPTAAGTGYQVLNAYPLMTTKAVAEGQRAADAQKRVFILTRSAYTGQQRNGAVSWSGDINGDFPTLSAQIPAGIHFSLSGIPYWNTDIGGFFPQTAIPSPEYQELYTRWFQYGAFCPMFRSHGTGGDKQMWAWGATMQARLLDIDRLRYRLLPYIYSVSWKVTHDAYTMMRGLVFDFRSDARALAIGDQFMFGPALLVNPVTTAGATSRSVYLPGTAPWYDFWTGASTTGGQTITASAPIERLPLYVRAGSILPLGAVMQYAAETPADPIELRVYRGADGAFALYEDENDNYNYEKGTYATIPFNWSEASKTLTIGARSGSFPGMLGQRTFRVVFVDATHGGGIAESTTIDRTVTYTGAAFEVQAP